MAMIYMNSLEFTKHFLDTDLDATKTLFVCVSTTLNLDLGDKRVIRIEELLPNAEQTGLFDGGYIDAYKTKYARHLQLTPLTATLATLAKYAINDERHVVLLCGVGESQFGYLETIALYMEAVMDFKVYNVKDYVKALRKGKLVSNFNDNTVGKVNRVLETAKQKEPDIEKMVDTIINSSYYASIEEAKREKKIKKKKKKKDKKYIKRNGLLTDDIDLLSYKE